MDLQQVLDQTPDTFAHDRRPTRILVQDELNVPIQFRDLLFEVAPFDPASLTASVAILVACGLAACAPSARRAVSIDPATVLRHY